MSSKRKNHNRENKVKSKKNNIGGNCSSRSKSRHRHQSNKNVEQSGGWWSNLFGNLIGNQDNTHNTNNKNNKNNNKESDIQNQRIKSGGRRNKKQRQY
jgi:hypothetical protein